MQCYTLTQIHKLSRNLIQFWKFPRHVILNLQSDYLRYTNLATPKLFTDDLGEILS